MKAMIGWFARNSVAANLLLAVIVTSGAITLTDLKEEVFPEISLDIVTITAEYRGASPEDVEEAICLRVEDAVQGVEGIKKITSTATEGRGSVQLALLAGYDVQQVLEEVKMNVGAVETFPEDVETPIIQQVNSRSQVINVVLSGRADLETLKRLGERVRDDLTALPEISQVELLNVPPYEISIEVSEEALRRWGLTFDGVAKAVRDFSVDLPGGSVKTKTGEILFRTKGQAYSGEEYENLLLLTRPDGTRILLDDVATVIDGFEDVGVGAKFDGEPAVTIKVYRVGEQSAVEIAEAVYGYVERFSATPPPGISIATWLDSAAVLKSRIDLLASNALTGLVLVFVVLALFLRLRLAFWVTLGIPVSFFGSIGMMPVFDISINMMSLFSFILVLGIVVDDAIVVGENIHSTQTRTGKGMRAAIRGTHEVMVPVTFGVLTTMAAFAPMLFVSGVTGKIMLVVPLIVLPTLFFSLIESNLILPCHLAHYKRQPDTAGRHAAVRLWSGFFSMFSEGLAWFIRSAYRPLLRWALEWRYVTVSIALFAMLITVGMVGAGVVRLVLFPTVESDAVIAFLTMPRDAPVESTIAGLDRIERAANELRREFAEEGEDPVLHMMTSIGQHPYREFQSGPAAFGATVGGDYLGEVSIELLPAEFRTTPSEEIANRWREKVGQVPGAAELIIEDDMIGEGKAVDLQLAGADLDTVREVAEVVTARLAEYPGVIDVADTYRAGKPEIQLSLTSEGEALGMTLRNLGRQVRQGFFGEEAQRVQRNTDDVRVMVRYPQGDRRSLGDLEQMRVRTPDGGEVPFSTVATGAVGRGSSTITRTDRRRSVNVQAEVDETMTTGRQVAAALESQLLPELMAKYPGISYEFKGEEADFAEAMEGLTKGFGIAMFVMFGMLAIPLKSYWKPTIILSAVPFGMVGAVWGHALLGLDLSFLSMCGMVALAGVVVNDGLVLVAFVNKKSRTHGSLKEAVQFAGEARFRAIVLTSLTTAAGVTPLIVEKSLQAQFLIPMAVALAAGVLFATMVTLVLVPALYLILEDVRTAFRWLLRGEGPQQRQSITAAAGQETASSD